MNRLNTCNFVPKEYVVDNERAREVDCRNERTRRPREQGLAATEQRKERGGRATPWEAALRKAMVPPPQPATLGARAREQRREPL